MKSTISASTQMILLSQFAMDQCWDQISLTKSQLSIFQNSQPMKQVQKKKMENTRMIRAIAEWMSHKWQSRTIWKKRLCKSQMISQARLKITIRKMMMMHRHNTSSLWSIFQISIRNTKKKKIRLPKRKKAVKKKFTQNLNEPMIILKLFWTYFRDINEEKTINLKL